MTNAVQCRDSTHLDLLGGSVRLEVVVLGESSSVTMTSGTIGTALDVRNTSTVDVSGGTMTNLFTFESGHVDFDNASVLDLIRAWDSSTITLRGGSVGSIT